jgi:hypothetical protein
MYETAKQPHLTLLEDLLRPEVQQAGGLSAAPDALLAAQHGLLQHLQDVLPALQESKQQRTKDFKKELIYMKVLVDLSCCARHHALETCCHGGGGNAACLLSVKKVTRTFMARHTAVPGNFSGKVRKPPTMSM